MPPFSRHDAVPRGPLADVPAILIIYISIATNELPPERGPAVKSGFVLEGPRAFVQQPLP